MLPFTRLDNGKDISKLSVLPPWTADALMGIDARCDREGPVEMFSTTVAAQQQIQIDNLAPTPLLPKSLCGKRAA